LRAYKIEQGAMPARIAVGRAYRINPGQDAVWPPVERAYGGEVESPWEQAAAIAAIVMGLLVPVLLLLTLLLAAYLYADALLAPRLPRFADGISFTIGDLVLPGCWTIIHLTNRRYGPLQAVVQLVTGLVLAGLIALLNPGDIDHWLPDLPTLTWRAVLGFFAAFAIANFAAIVAFDAARGPRWWSAPLMASAVAALVFTGLYYPLAFGHVGINALGHLLLWLAEGVTLLLPYCLLRPAMRPLNGMNGL